MYTAAALLYPQALATSITLPMEILQAAGQMARAKRQAGAGVKFLLASADGKPVTLGSGIALVPDVCIEDLPLLDLLILPAIWRNPVPVARRAGAWLDQLRAHARTGTRICSVGTGGYLLAEAGLLDGKPATTHWRYLEDFSRRYPRVKLKSRHLITQSDNIYCAGSVNSIADLLVHVTGEWFGTDVGRAVENQFSPEIRRSFHAAAYQGEADSSHHDEDIATAQQWLQANLAEDVTLSRLAEAVGMNQRTLGRRFKRATGISPMNYLQSVRMASARDLLRHSNLGVGEIAWQVGLRDGSYFTQLFRRHSGMTPLKYREAVRGKLFDPDISAQPPARPR
jgi:transcriptional regulator GlxA family with amidase domain